MTQQNQQTARPRVLTRRAIRQPVPRSARRDLVCGYRRYRAQDGLTAFFPETVVDRCLEFTRDAKGLEWMGLLAGRVHADDGGTYVVVTGVVPHADARRRVTSVEVSADSDRSARALTAAHFPDSTIVGWVHSHPHGSGASFSPTDFANQRTWPDSWSIGVVVEAADPKVLGVYRGPDGERMHEESELQAHHERADAPTMPLHAREPQSPTQKDEPWRRRASIGVAALAIVGAASLSGWCAYDAYETTRFLQAQSALMEATHARMAEQGERSMLALERLAERTEQLAKAAGLPWSECPAATVANMSLPPEHSAPGAPASSTPEAEAAPMADHWGRPNERRAPAPAPRDRPDGIPLKSGAVPAPDARSEDHPDAGGPSAEAEAAS